MKYIFLDESGDSGFGNKSSKYILFISGSSLIPLIRGIIIRIKKVRQKILKKTLKNVNNFNSDYGN